MVTAASPVTPFHYWGEVYPPLCGELSGEIQSLGRFD